jgi:CRP/FNR family transcriptional regulator
MTSSSGSPLSTTPVVPTSVSLLEIKTHCLNCSVRELCLPVGVDREGLHQIDTLVTERLRLKKGDTVYRAGDPFSALHAIYLGLQIETVSRVLSRFQAAGMIQVQGRAVKLLDLPALRHLAGQRR